MADVLRPTPLSVRGPLDTTNPITDRPPGTLVEATDMATRWWGPRLGMRQFATVLDVAAASRSGAGENLITFDGVDDDATGTVVNADQVKLGVRWTLDLVFRIEDLDHTTSNATLFEWNSSDTVGGDIGHDPHTVLVEIITDGANEGKIVVRLETNNGSNALVDDVAITSDTALTAGTDPEDIHFLRVVRDRANVWVVQDRAEVGTSTAMTATATNPPLLTGAGSSFGYWNIGGPTSSGQHSTNAFFKGKIYKVLLRTGKHVEYTAGYHDVIFPRARSVKLAVVGQKTTIASTDYVLDHSRFESRGTIAGSPSTADSFDAPFLHPIQGMNFYTDVEGSTFNVVKCGGRIYLEKVL